jgi:hypothetical protein
MFSQLESSKMCRNIRPLFNFDPPATDAEIRDASLQFVRKISGFSRPSRVNEHSFTTAVDQIVRVSTALLRSLETNAEPKNREQEITKARARNLLRYPQNPSGK